MVMCERKQQVYTQNESWKDEKHDETVWCSDLDSYVVTAAALNQKRSTEVDDAAYALMRGGTK